MTTIRPTDRARHRARPTITFTFVALVALGAALAAALVACGDSNAGGAGDARAKGDRSATASDVAQSDAEAGATDAPQNPAPDAAADATRDDQAAPPPVKGCAACSADESCLGGVCLHINKPATENCASYPFKASTLLAERAGFGRNSSGGDPNTLYWVTTLADSGPGSLREGLQSSKSQWIVFKQGLAGTIKLSGDGGRIRVRSNKTVDGRGRDITIHGELRVDSGVHDVIISDIKLTNPRASCDLQSPDAITVVGSKSESGGNLSTRRLWFHHLELTDAADGLLDIRWGVTDVTLSFLHMHKHKKAMLISARSSSGDAKGADHLDVTFHHNFLDQLSLRGPLFNGGRADFYNNLQYRWYEFGVASNDGSKLLSENNLYQARPGPFCLPACPDPNPCGDSDYIVSKKAVVAGWADAKGYVRSVGDVTSEPSVSIEQHQPQLVFKRSDYYSASIEPADNRLEQRIRRWAGPRRTYCR